MEDFQNSVTANPSPAIKKDFSRVGLALIVYLVVVTVVQILTSAICLSLYPELAESSWYLWALTCLPQAFIGAPICLLMLRTKSPSETFG